MYPNIKLLLKKRGWITNEGLIEYLDILAASLKDSGPRKIVLVMDAHSTHCSLRTLKHIRSLGWMVLLIPGKLTWLLQPLDVYFFAQFKQKLYAANMEDRISRDSGTQNFDQWADTCCKMIQHAFSSITSQHMFHICGCELPSRNISQGLLQYVPHENLGKHRKLTVNELTAYIGRRADLLHHIVFPMHVPVAMTEQSVSIRCPLQRFRSKRSASTLVDA